ncbi:helix-turn-helix domain-containing protein [Niameybacter massiliensis]|uniref:Helix-turn-helix domain-containing protein n=1 Tax=Holtiella tumoricola TaxID=3018743 RepID=A0AA42J162_9FIRM|nr:MULTISPECIES: helix-turn-helix domain-containing protein [Lachnospirales]MDA3732005.1 helix-turn-helix domain-containing protein [Holtiella tumoricola]
MYNIDEIIYSCPVEALSNILGKKWIAIIIWKLQDNKMRFGELQRAIDGCTKKMLIQQLDVLIDQGIVINDKKVSNNSVESTYYLSEAGIKLLPIMANMMAWSNQHLPCGH